MVRLNYGIELGGIHRGVAWKQGSIREETAVGIEEVCCCAYNEGRMYGSTLVLNLFGFVVNEIFG